MAHEPVRSREEGFTLLEVIVAFAVLALSLTAINTSVGLATSQIKRAEEVRRAEELSQDVLADIVLSDTAIPKNAQGQSESGLRWRLTSLQLDAGARLPTARVSLEITAGSGRRIREYTTFLSRPVE